MPYDIDRTFATYLVENIRGPEAADLFVTMYGPNILNIPRDPLVTSSFAHGLWLPSAMEDTTKLVCRGQGRGGLNGEDAWLPNTGTNLYFAGNNTTMDSVEGALGSAMVMANYAFGVGYPLPMHAAAYGMYCYQYFSLMFLHAPRTAAIRLLAQATPLPA